MSLQELKQHLQNRTARLCVIGLGYVGLPVAAKFAEAGFDVLGVEIKPERVEMINRGISPIDGNEPGMAELIEKVVAAKKLRATFDYQEIRDRDVVLIDVETPVDERHYPRYEALRAALKSLGAVLKDGALVVVESTIAPGTIKRLVLPMLEEATGRKLNQGFYLGACPERVMPGKLLSNLCCLSRVVGGGNPETTEAMIELYRHIVQAELDPADWITAELVKTVENAYRDVQIAFANEIALVCEALGGDVWKVRELVNKSPFRMMHMPGAGVGGHCIPKDPWLLAFGVEGTGLKLRMVPTARAINQSMPLHMVDLVQQTLALLDMPLKGARILVLGYAYLENSDDTRNSPSELLVERLGEMGAEVVIHDPYVNGYKGNVLDLAKGCDALVLMVRHQEYLRLDLAALKPYLRRAVLIDGRGVFKPEDLHRLGYLYRAVGMGAREQTAEAGIGS